MRFSIASLMLTTLVFAVMASATHHLLRAVTAGGTSKAPFVIATLTLPIGALLVISFGVGGWRWWRSRTGLRPPDSGGIPPSQT